MAAPRGWAPIGGALGPFDLQSVVASGAMGTVLRGQHRRSGLAVAVKVLNGALVGDKALRDSLLAEAGMGLLADRVATAFSL